MIGSIEPRHPCGRLTAHERMELLLDPESLEALGAEPISGVVAGAGRVNGRPVFVYVQDRQQTGESLTARAQQIVALQDMALQRRAPLVSLLDPRGLPIQEGAALLSAYGEILERAARAAGVIPQISLIMGASIGADAFVPAMSDFTFMLRDRATWFVTGPEVVKSVSNQSVAAEDLGGGAIHAAESGLVDAIYDNEVVALLQLRRLLDLLPSSRDAALPSWPSFDDPQRIETSLESLVPDDPARAYDVKELIFKIVDEGDFFEIREAHARNIVTGFGRIEGRPIGIVANQPLVLAGALDIHALRKAARFVRFCAGFNIPIVSFVDVPGFLPGAAQEHGGVASEGAKLLSAYAEARVPKVTIALRNAFGAAFLMMGSKPLGAHISCAWPSALIGLVGATGAAERVFSPDEQDVSETVVWKADYERQVLSPAAAIANGFVDALIAPQETRLRIVAALASLRETSR